MTVESIQSSVLENLTSQYTTTVTEEESDSMGQDAFLKIFLTQLEYQDPLSPMEGTEMTSQLAQFSSLEQQTNTNDLLEEISLKLDTQSENRFLDYVGKEVMILSDAMTIEEGELSGASFAIEEDANVEVAIYDSNGSEINRLSLGWLEAGYHDVDWDGKDSAGNLMEDGKYSFEVIATDDSGEEVTAQTAYSGRVTGITYEWDTPYLLIGEGLVDPEAVVRVLESGEDTAESSS